MTSFISHTSVDCSDAYGLSTWWQAVLDYVRDDGDPDQPGDEECLIISRDEELARLLEFGARVVDDRRQADGTGWVVLADPEGNEFCILRSAAERRT